MKRFELRLEGWAGSTPPRTGRKSLLGRGVDVESANCKHVDREERNELAGADLKVPEGQGGKSG